MNRLPKAVIQVELHQQRPIAVVRTGYPAASGWQPGHPVAWFFFLSAIMVLIFSLTGMLMPLVDSVQERFQEKIAAVRQNTPAQREARILNNSRPEIIKITLANQRFELLGLGRAQTNKQPVVWLRNMKTNQIGGFEPGDSLFTSNIKLLTVAPEALTLQAGTVIHQFHLGPASRGKS